MSTVSIIFYILEALAALSAVAILFTKNVFYGTLLLITSLLSVAGIYILANAEFVAVTQILIYAGGVLVLIIFSVMLTSKISGKSLVTKNQHWFAGSIVGLSIFIALVIFYTSTSFFTGNPPTPTAFTPINQIGILLMTDYILPFEVAGILLLVALVGAAVVASSLHSIKKT
jgi:NADH:ubiquinone oxidoreductase subunit 6 (subunit J)